MPDHNYFSNLIWQIADLLRGPYRPPQYERVMLPMTVLRRFDCVLAPTKAKVDKPNPEWWVPEPMSPRERIARVMSPSPAARIASLPSAATRLCARGTSGTCSSLSHVERSAAYRP